MENPKDRNRKKFERSKKHKVRSYAPEGRSSVRIHVPKPQKPDKRKISVTNYEDFDYDS